MDDQLEGLAATGAVPALPFILHSFHSLQTVQVDDQLEGLAALDDEAEYQRFLAGLRDGEGAGAAFSSFLDGEQEDEGARHAPNWLGA